MFEDILQGFWTTNYVDFDNPDKIYKPSSTRIARYQLIVALVLGSSAFLTFCILRIRYPKIYVANFNHSNANYVHSSSRQNLPKLPAKSMFGWIPILYNINETQVLDHAGLDAVVFLEFFKMCIKLLSVCFLFAISIISPIRYKFTGKVDQDYPDDDDDGDSTRGWILENEEESYEHFLWMYTVFTYVFTFIVTFFLFRQTDKIIRMRQKYLGNQNSVTDRTIKISGIPSVLRDEEDLKRHIEGLGIGEIEKIVVVKQWNDLNRLFKARKALLRKIELHWIKFFKMNGIKNIYDLANSSLRSQVGDSFGMTNTHEEDGEIQSHISNQASIIDEIAERVEGEWTEESVNQLPLLNDEIVKRPKFRKGLLGLFGPEVDAITYHNERLEIVDKEILRTRIRDFPASSTAFVTMKSVSQAQMVAQAVLDPKVNHLITNLAPAPHDVIWDNLCLTRRERNMRIFAVTLLITLMSIVLVFPVKALSNFLNIKSISRIWPKLGELLKQNKWAESAVTGLLPTYLFTILNIIMPYIYVWISAIQGYTSHSDEELSAVSKNFFYIFVNLFLVFTLFGTATLSDTTRIAYQLAQSLRDLSLFYVDLIILQGLGIFPYKLLSLGNLIKFSVSSLLWSKTPRDYLKLNKPPVFNFGLNLPQPILILIITLVYSVMSTKILTAGLLYFIIGYFVTKYQLLYACIHPPHSTGRVWPLVFRRVVLGLWLFQLTMVGTLALQKAYICATFLSPLPILTLLFLYNFQKNYIPLSIFIALRSIEENNQPYEEDNVQGSESATQHSHLESQTLDERREHNQTYEYPHLIEDLDGPIIAIEGNYFLIVNADGTTTRKKQTFDAWD